MHKGIERIVRASVVDADDFVIQAELPQNGMQLMKKPANARGLVMKRKNEGKFGHRLREERKGSRRDKEGKREELREKIPGHFVPAFLSAVLRFFSRFFP
jgi:hypothetical protein